MDRQNLINRLMSRKLTSSNKSKAFCICYVRRASALCYARATAASPKK